MRQAIFLLLFSMMLFSEMKATSVESDSLTTKSEAIIKPTAKQDSVKVSPKKAYQQAKKKARKQFRKDNPKSFSEVFTTTILPALVSATLAIMGCHK